MAKAIGIDLGSSTSSVAWFDGKQARLLVADERERLMPTIVQHDPTNMKVNVGLFAHRTAVTNPDFTYTGLKRLLGRQYNDPLVQETSERVAYALSYGPNGEAWVKTPDGSASPEELLSHVLRHLKNVAQTAIGEQVSFAVVGVPASFEYPQKMAVRRACEMAGLEVRKLLHEPTAAAVAYGMERGLGKTIAVYDFGGGTFDASVLKVTGRNYKVLGTKGDPFLGGEDFDARLLDYVSDRFRAARGFDPRSDHMTLLRLRLAVEKAKVELSSVEEYRLLETRFAREVTTGVLFDLDETIQRFEFEELVEDLIDRTRRPCLDAMLAAKVEPRDIDDVVLVGGVTRMPRVQEAVREIFGKDPAVSKINPVEAVTIGCSIIAAAIAGETRAVQLDDILPTNIGLEASGGSFVPVLRRGTRLPNAKTVVSAPQDPAAVRAAVRIWQGDAGNARDNASIGVVVIDELPESPDADKEIAITFALDDDAILSVTLKHVASGRVAERRFDANSGLDAADMERIRGLAEDEEVGPEPEPVAEPEAAQEPEPAMASEPEPMEAVEGYPQDPRAADELDPPEPAADSAPAPAAAPSADAGPAGDAVANDDDLPPMPGEPRWAKPAEVAAE